VGRRGWHGEREGTGSGAGRGAGGLAQVEAVGMGRGPGFGAKVDRWQTAARGSFGVSPVVMMKQGNRRGKKFASAHS
jgi:hypothetical protein